MVLREWYSICQASLNPDCNCATTDATWYKLLQAFAVCCFMLLDQPAMRSGPCFLARSVLVRLTKPVMQDELIERLGGPDKVAEMSGRKKRMVKQPDGQYKYLSRAGPHTGLDGVSVVCLCTLA